MAVNAAERPRRSHMLPLQTSLARSNASPQDSSKSSEPASAYPKTGTPEQDDYQRFVLADPVAFQYLEADKSTRVVARHQKLQGYECYLVEQWVTSRINPTFVISTYTGDSNHTIAVDVLSVPSDERAWSPRLRVYFKALNQYHARRESTPLGTLMVTNLSSFPSTLSVIPVPGGDIKQHQDEYVVNENLKRLGCSGRIGLTLAAPAANSVAKFYQLYHASDKNKIYESVIELVQLCQDALVLFDKLEPDYADGLLCDITEHAISDWWNDFGTEQYGIEPHDGILGPLTVAALLGSLMGARNRLHSFGAPVSKDPFDLDAMKRGISSFQGQQRLPRTRRLDRQTMQRLLRATAKAAAHEGWKVPRAVKSTVAELSGRGGEMISDVVGRGDRVGIAEVETTDIERFVQLAFGPRPRWLWQGKPLKKTKPMQEKIAISLHSVSHRRKDDAVTKEDAPESAEPHTPTGDTDGSAAEDSKGLRKRATDLKDNAMSGFGKIKGAVNLKYNHQRFAGREKGQSPASPEVFPATSSEGSSPGSPFSGPASPFSPLREDMPDFSLLGSSRAEADGEDGSATECPTLRIEGSIYEGVDLKQTLPEGDETQHDVGRLLRRTISDSLRTTIKSDVREADYYPKHLSFSLAEDSVLPWSSLTDEETPPGEDDEAAVKARYAEQALDAEEKKLVRTAIGKLHTEAADWTQQQLITLRQLVQQYQRNAEDLQASHEHRHEQKQALSANLDLLMRSEQEHLDEGIKELETLSARLTYEIDGLRGRVEDVENIVDDFESGVRRVENRVTELENNGDGNSDWKCTVM